MNAKQINYIAQGSRPRTWSNCPYSYPILAAHVEGKFWFFGVCKTLQSTSARYHGQRKVDISTHAGIWIREVAWELVEVIELKAEGGLNAFAHGPIAIADDCALHNNIPTTRR